MKKLLSVLVIMIGIGLPVEARTGPDNSLGIDPARVEEMRELMADIDPRWAAHVGRVLEGTSISHRFSLGRVVSGPVPIDPEPRMGNFYSEYLHCGGGCRGSNGSRENPNKRFYRFKFENLVLHQVKRPADRDISFDVLFAAMIGGATFDEIVRFTYDFVVVFDNDAGDDTSYRMVMPMDVTVFCTTHYGPRPGDGCKAIQNEYCLLEASYGPLLFIAESAAVP